MTTRTSVTALGIEISVIDETTVLLSEHDGRIDHLKFTHHNGRGAADAIGILLDRAYRQGFNEGVEKGGYL